MAAAASCIGVRAMLRPSTRAIATSDPEPPSTKLPVIQVPQTNGNVAGAGNSGSLMSRHDLVTLFARDAPLAKAQPVLQATGEKAPAWAPSELVKTAASEANTVTKKFEGLFHSLVPGSAAPGELEVLKGYVVIQKKILALDLADLASDKMDDIDECAGRHVTIQIVSTKVDPQTKKPLTSEEVAIKNWNYTIDLVVSAKFGFNMEFDVPKDFGKPGAIVVKNRHKNEFLLDSFTLTMPDNSTVNFPAKTWVYSTLLQPGRIIFSNETYITSETPDGLVTLREQELENLRGDGKGERKFGDRIYDYDVYNDLGDPDFPKGLLQGPMPRPVLGGSQELPYPRRCRTGRAPCHSDPKSESKGPLLDFYYIPRDEKFDQVKFSDFAAESVRGVQHNLIPTLYSTIAVDKDFQSFEEIKYLYAQKGAKIDVPNNLIPRTGVPEKILTPGEPQPLTFIHEWAFPTGPDTAFLQFPLPDIIAGDDKGWSADVEFGREMLAGVNPLVIQRLKEFPIKSSLDPKEFGDPASKITKEIIEAGMKDIDGGNLTVEQAMDQKRLFIQDFHDIYLPYINKINSQNSAKMYAARTVLFLTKENTLVPLAIELALPPPKQGGKKNSRVFTPKMDRGVWSLAKAHVASVDTGYHEVVSHFLRTHCCMEPFIIATNRQLSALHPVHQVIVPHYKNTMDINAAARKALINAGGIIEDNFTSGQYTMEMSSVVYKLDWRFDEQALPEDLIKRGMAERDPNSPHGIKLVISDYPYAADGLELWAALKDYMTAHVSLFYKSDDAVTQDTELQSWWTEARTVGHGDKKDAPGWPTLNSIESLAYTLTTIAWVGSCHHAAVNFGQYPYGGYMPNRPSMTRKLIPEDNTSEYNNLKDPKQWEKAFLQTVSNHSQATQVMSTVEILSTHAIDEEYLGQRSTPNWSNDPRVLDAFSKFSQKMKDIEQIITDRNNDPSLKNRSGPVRLPYGLLLPTSPSPGLTGKGVPYSISI